MLLVSCLVNVCNFHLYGPHIKLINFMYNGSSKAPICFFMVVKCSTIFICMLPQERHGLSRILLVCFLVLWRYWCVSWCYDVTGVFLGVVMLLVCFSVLCHSSCCLASANVIASLLLTSFQQAPFLLIMAWRYSKYVIF